MDVLNHPIGIHSPYYLVKILCISDAEDDFNLKKIFNLVTDKFQVEGKGTNSWDFDDGVTSTSEDPEHIFQTVKTHNVT